MVIISSLSPTSQRKMQPKRQRGQGAEQPFSSSSPAREDDGDALAAKDARISLTRSINILRFVTFILLLSIAILASLIVYRYTENYEQEKFESNYLTNAQLVVESFHETVERKLGAVNTLADSITSHALSTGEKFPRVTMPNFSVHGGNARVHADSLIVEYAPIVTDDTREEWEEYALANRFKFDEAYEQDVELRNGQDEKFGIVVNYTSDPRPLGPNETVLDDITNYHPRIWSNGVVTPQGDEKEGTGPYLPIWQRSPIRPQKQAILNMNLAHSRPLAGVLPELLEKKEAVMNRAEIPKPDSKAVLELLQRSHYREESVEFRNDPFTFFAYPVFDSFGEDRQVVGVLSVATYWRLLFKNILPVNARGYLCILENSFNQTMVFRIDGPEASYLGEGDPHAEHYHHLEQFADVNAYVKQHREWKAHRSYTTVPLNNQFGRYRLRIYPTNDTEKEFTTNKPWIYTVAVLSVFLLTVIVLILLDRSVARRQRIVMDRLVKTAEEKAAHEQELNTFLAHEVRNPVAAAMSAHGFVVSAVNEIPATAVANKELLLSLQDDVKVIGSSLSFIDDFLRSTLDIYASNANKLTVSMAPTELLKDVLEPVQSILHQRNGNVDVTVECPETLIIMTDCLRLKQVMMNLGRNSIKFVTNGFLRFRVTIVDGLVELSVEDSGPGIPVDKQDALFERFQTSLDVLSQGTGLGLSLCLNLVVLLNGRIFLDKNYDSGVPGSPGARFVVQLNQPSLPVESLLPSSEFLADDTSGESASSSISKASIVPENLSVLFVDDDNVLRKLFRRAVKKVAPSWTISEAASGEAALQLVEEMKYDVIFMDQYMASTQKQMLGTETVRELRVRGVDSIICGLSANNMEESFLNAGADAFLLKPFPCEREAMERELARISQSRSPV